MSIIPRKMRQEMALDPYYSYCARNELFHDHECLPDPVTKRLIEWEHALYYAGSKIQDSFAIVPLCWWAHRGPGLNKEMNQLLALLRATEEQLRLYPRTNWVQRRGYLREKYLVEKAVNKVLI